MSFNKIFFAMLLVVGVMFGIGMISRVRAQQFIAPLTQPQVTTITVPTTELAQDKSLGEYLVENKDTPPLLIGFLRPLMTMAVERGVSAEKLAFLLLFPAVASLVAFSRHVIGLSGFSVFAPVGLSLVFLSAGIVPGIVLFALMLMVATLSKWLISKMKLEYVPRTSMLFLFVSIGLGLTLICSTFYSGLALLRIDMFPLLLLALLAEEFMAPISGMKLRLILERSVEIMVLAIIGALLIGNVVVQRFAILNPEVVLGSVGLANFVIGRYLGLRLTEYFRFRPLMDAEE